MSIEIVFLIVMPPMFAVFIYAMVRDNEGLQVICGAVFLILSLLVADNNRQEAKEQAHKDTRMTEIVRDKGE